MNKLAEERHEIINVRNERVVYNKTRETGWARLLSIITLTYIAMVVYLG